MTRHIVMDDKISSWNRERLTAFYEKYNAEKIREVDVVLSKYKGKENQLFNALVRKYGPEPGDSNDESNDSNDEEPMSPIEEDDSTLENVEETEDLHQLRRVVYCPVDSLPAEYCEYGPCFDECKAWLAAEVPTLYLQKYGRTVKDLMEAERQIADGVKDISLEISGTSKIVKSRKKIIRKSEQTKSTITISTSSRKGRKHVTIICGLEEYLEDPMTIKEAAKKLGKRFACSASIIKSDSGVQQIQLQGECQVELMQVLPDMFDVDERTIIVSDRKKK